MEDYKKLLTDLYKVHDPERVKQIDYFLERYKGKESQFYISQEAKYKSRKPVSESKKIIEEALARIKSQSSEATIEKQDTIVKPELLPDSKVEEAPIFIQDDIQEIAIKEEISNVEPFNEEEPVAKDEPEVYIERKVEERHSTFYEDILKTRASEGFTSTDSPHFNMKTEKKVEKMIEDKDTYRSQFEKMPSLDSQNETIHTPRKQTREIPWSDEIEKDDIPTEKPSFLETDNRYKKRYFLNIFGMVLLAIVLSVIAYSAFFTPTTKKTIATVVKPVIDRTGKSENAAINNTSDAATKSAFEKKKTEQQTNQSLAKTPEQKPTNSTTIKEKTVVENKKAVEESGIAKEKTVQKESSTSFWKKLFGKKEETAKPINKTATKAPETKQAILAPTEKPTEVKQEITPKTIAPLVKTTQQEQISTTFSGMHLKKGDINLPAYFVACYAVKTEIHAVTKVNQLKAKGFTASYYWIPDFVPQGNSYFKVVIGPFATQREAFKTLTPVQERAEFDAYVLTLK